MPQFNEIRRTGYLPDLIAGQIMSQISGGELQPGDPLPTETALAKAFGVSRNVVREAIARLRFDGVIETKQGRGAVVLSPAHRTTFRVDMEALAQGGNLADLFELRAMLEIEAAGLAAARRSDEALDTLEAALTVFEEANGFDAATLEADAEFHRTIGAATGNAYLTTIIGYLSSRLKETTKATDAVYEKGDLFDVTKREHRAVCDAIRAQDVAQARDAMARHIAGASARLGVASRDG